MRNQRMFQLTCVDQLHGTHLREEPGTNAKHAARKLLDKHPEYWKILSNKGNPILIRDGVRVPPFPAHGAMRAALEEAQSKAASEIPQASMEAAAEVTERKPMSMMAQIRQVILPHLSELPLEFKREEVENLLRAYGAEHLINRTSVNNVLNSWAMEKPPQTVRRAALSNGDMKAGYFVVLDKVRNDGRKAVRMAANAERSMDTEAIDTGAARREFTDPANAPKGGRNALYMHSHPALRHSEPTPTNGHARNGHGLNGGGLSPPEPALAPPATAAEPSPVLSVATAARRVAQTLTEDGKANLFTLLAGGVIGAANDDKVEMEAAMDLVMQGYDRLTKIMERQIHLAGVRERVGQLLQQSI